MSELQWHRLSEYPVVSVDVETTGVYWYKDKIFGIAVAAFDGRQYLADYIDLRTPAGQHKFAMLKAELPRVRKLVNHSMKFDAHFLLNEGLQVPLDKIECTMVRAALIDEHRHEYSLDSLMKKHTDIEKVDIYGELAEMFGGRPTRAAQMPNLQRAPERLARKYAIVDPVGALKLWQWQEEEIAKQNLHQVWGLERQLTPILIQIERQGVRVDVGGTHKELELMDPRINKAQEMLNRLAGRDMNANSPKQMREMFKVEKRKADNPYGYEHVTDTGIILPTTETGEASIGKDTLIIMSEQGDQRAEQVLRLRKLIKAKSFLKDHILGHEVGGRVYPNYNQTKGDNDLGTGTGRFSINDPALQQIPARDVDIAEIVRSKFLPEEDHDWVCADWAQFEFRWFAHYTNDPNIRKVYDEDPDADYHQTVSDLTGIPRKPRFAGDANSKQINLGMVFGMGKGKMAYEMGMDYSIRYSDDGKEWYSAGPKAQSVFDTYHNAIPGVGALLAQASSIAKSRGYVQTIMGRHIRFPGGKFTHKAAGLVFQGSSADCIKQKMIELWPVMSEYKSMMLLSVHDELDFSTPKGITKAVKAYIKEVLETFDGERCPIKCRIPIRSSVDVGPNWFEASK